MGGKDGECDDREDEGKDGEEGALKTVEMESGSELWAKTGDRLSTFRFGVGAVEPEGEGDADEEEPLRC